MVMIINKFLENLVDITLESSKWILIGLIIGSIISIFIKQISLTKHLAPKRLSSIIKATLIGIPLPLCSCGVLPVAKSLSKSGASKGSVSAFLISTPEIGVDSFLLSYGILGAPFAFLRLISATITSLFVGIIINYFDNKIKTNNREEDRKEQSCASCCNHEESTKEPSNKENIVKKLIHSFLDLSKDLSTPLMIGFTISALVASIFSPQSVAIIKDNLPLSYIIIGLSSSLLYICATSSTPLALILLNLGFSPGSILILLLLGPATNSTTFLVLKQIIGTKFTFIFFISTLLITLSIAGLVDNLSMFNLTFKHTSNYHNHLGISDLISAIVLILLICYSTFIKFIVKKR